MGTLAKMCPRCGRICRLDAAKCKGCGHKFRTKFTIPEEQTEAQLPPVSAEYLDSEFLQLSLLECRRQYSQLTWQRIACLLLAPFFVGLILYLFLRRQDRALRDRVSALGIDAHAWEIKQRSRRMTTIRVFFGMFFLIVLMLTAISPVRPLVSSRAAHSAKAIKRLFAASSHLVQGGRFDLSRVPNKPIPSAALEIIFQDRQ